MANLWKRHLSAAELTTILVVVVPIFIIWIAVGITHKQDRRPVMDLSNLRQISAAFDAYATDNHDYGPGLDSRGKIRYATVEDRYLSLLKPVYISPDALVSVYDEKTQWTAGRISSANYSYSMLQLPTTGGRLSQWRIDADPESVLLSGRNSGTDATSDVNSIQIDAPGEWHGPVAWGDGHVTNESTHLVDTHYLKDGPVNTDDNLFEAVGTDDAYMIYTGN